MPIKQPQSIKCAFRFWCKADAQTALQQVCISCLTHMTQETGVGIASMAAVGPNIWVGLTDGRVRVYKDSGQQDFQAHDAGVIAIVPCGSRAFTLAADGSLKGWNALSPSPLDAAAR